LASFKKFLCNKIRIKAKEIIDPGKSLKETLTSDIDRIESTKTGKRILPKRSERED
jgi:hypothetical protein